MLYNPCYFETADSFCVLSLFRVDNACRSADRSASSWSCRRSRSAVGDQTGERAVRHLGCPCDGNRNDLHIGRLVRLRWRRTNWPSDSSIAWRNIHRSVGPIQLYFVLTVTHYTWVSILIWRLHHNIVKKIQLCMGGMRRFCITYYLPANVYWFLLAADDKRQMEVFVFFCSSTEGRDMVNHPRQFECTPRQLIKVPEYRS